MPYFALFYEVVDDFVARHYEMAITGGPFLA